MIARILAWTIHQRLRRLSFSGQTGDTARTATRDVLRSFGAGIDAGLHGLPRAAAEGIASRFPWHRRTFYWEGVAFALAALHACAFRRGCPDDRRLVSAYRAVHFTGYGLWNGLARIYPLPRMSLAPSRWAGAGDFPRYLPLLIGGTAFATAFFRGRFDRGLLAELRISDRVGARAAVHGFGRALWFLYMDDCERLGRVLDEHRDLRQELLEGMGSAIAFTSVGVPEEIAARLERFSAGDQSPLLRGVGASLVTLVEEDPDNQARLHASIRQPRLLDAWDCVRRADDQAGDGPDWYWDSLERARELLP